MMISKKAHIMQALSITDEQLLKDKAKVVEKCFCAALLNQDPKVIGAVTRDFNNLMDELYEQPHIRCTASTTCTHIFSGDGFIGCNAQIGTCEFQSILSRKV